MASDLSIEVVDDTRALDRLRDEWDQAAAADPQPNVFLTWEWVRTWWAHFGARGAGSIDGHAGAELHVVVVRDGYGVVALAPLQRSPLKTGPLRTRILQRIAPEAGDYGGIVVARRPDEVVAALVDHLAGELRDGRAAAVVLSRIASDDPLLGLLRDATTPRAAGLTSRRVVRQRNALAGRAASLAWHETVLGGACPLTDLRHGFDLAKHTKKHKIRQRLRRLGERHDDVTFARHTGATLDEGLDRLLQVHARRWADRAGDLQGLLAEPAKQAFLLDAVRALDARGWVNLLSLTTDGRPIAAELDFAYRGRIVMFKGAFDPDYAAFSPGQLLHHRVFEDAMADGVEVVDFGRGDQLYKRRWANRERHLVTVTLTPAGLPGRLARHRLRVAQAFTRRLRGGSPRPRGAPPT